MNAAVRRNPKQRPPRHIGSDMFESSMRVRPTWQASNPRPEWATAVIGAMVFGFNGRRYFMRHVNAK